MSEITKGDHDAVLKDKAPTDKNGVPVGASEEDSHGGYGGTDRLKTETGPLDGTP